MNQTSETSPAAPFNSILAEPLEVGEPDVSGPLVVFPILGPEPELDYQSFAKAHAASEIAIGELAGGASVNDLAVDNLGDKPVLLYEGEELLGAQQNRVLDISLLIAAQTKTPIPVSCVEAGRWDGRRRNERFRPSRQAADPEMRKLKHRRVRERVAMGEPARANQGEVWNEVGNRLEALAVRSPTAAMSDLYQGRRAKLGEIGKPIRLHEGQCGAVCAINGQISILDYVGRPDVWADLHPALLEGYALDALRFAQGQDDVAEPPEIGTVRGFTLLVTDAPADNRRHEAGLGETVRFAAGGVAGSALVVPLDERVAGSAGRDELVQLTAYPDGSGPGEHSEPEPDRATRTRVRRPSRRRSR
ncbi:MAG: hypothetical protein JJE23_10935 [Thermoleophilia bacterium]|nr:hypothetical protein [Thermoleophilia bacterium]